MSTLQTIFMCGSDIGFFVVMIYNIVKNIKKHSFFVGIILGIFKGTLFGAVWLFAWPVTMWVFLWYLFVKPHGDSHTKPYDDDDKSDDGRTLLDDLLCLQREPIYNIFGDEIGTARTFGDKIFDVDAPGVSADDIERDAFGDWRIKS